MNFYSLYFSPTGGTKKVMDILSGILAEDCQTIDLSLPDKDYSSYSFTKNDLCLIGVPSFGGRVPGIALEHLKQIKAASASAVLVATFGNRAFDDTLLELKNEMETCGFRVIAAAAAVTEHSIMHQYGTGRPDAEDEKELRNFALRLKEAFTQDKKSTDILVPGNQPYREYKGVPLKPKAEKECTKCRLCASLCPVAAIPKEDPSQTDKDLCISCMRCISVCPNHARTLNKAMLLASGQMLKKACHEKKENQFFF